MHSAFYYTALDFAGALWGAVAFLTATVAPGYVVGFALNLADFRERSRAEQFAWSLVLSLGAGTILIVGFVWAVGLSISALCLGLLSAVAVALMLRRGKPPLRGALLPGALFLLWAFFVVLSLIDLGAGPRLWMSVTSYDHAVRVPLVDAVMRTGVVPANPLYWPGHNAPLRYYYFWYVTCGVVAKLAHISPRQAFTASCVWPLIGVAAMASLFGKHVLGWQHRQLRSRTWIAVGLMAVTGLDLIVTAANFLRGAPAYADMEWWSVDQVTSWLDDALWVPHHVASLVCVLLSYLCLWMAQKQEEKKQRTRLVLIAGISFASSFGLSVYVAIGFAIVMVIWLGRTLFTESRFEWLRGTLVAGLFAALLLAPYVRQLARPDAVAASASVASMAQPSPTSAEKRPRILKLEMRQMVNPWMILNKRPFRGLEGRRAFIATQVIDAALLVPSYALELGFFALVLVCSLRWKEKSEGERALLFLTIAALISASFVRSAVIATNDYGIRATMLAQFMLLLLGVRVCEEATASTRFWLRVLAFLGVCGSIYQAIELRLYLPWQELHGNPAAAALAERNYVLRTAYSEMDRKIPRDARVQYDPGNSGYVDYAEALQAGRQMVSAGPTCNVSFGGDISPCAAIRNGIAQLYSAGALPEAEAGHVCDQIGVQYLMVTRWDTVWTAKDSWVWTLPAVVALPDARVVRCGVR